METLHEGRGNGVTEWRPSLRLNRTGFNQSSLRDSDEIYKSILELLMRILELTKETVNENSTLIAWADS